VAENDVDLDSLALARDTAEAPQDTAPIAMAQTSKPTTSDGIRVYRVADTASVPAPDSSTPVVGRNDPCPCGSGKKYKHCHG